MIFNLFNATYQLNITRDSVNLRNELGRYRGQYVIYTGGSLALSCLEKLAHTSGTSLYAGDFSVMIYKVPDKLKIGEITLTELAGHNAEWTKVINYPYTQAIGDQWLRNREIAILKVPSAIIDLEYNYLLNPAHPDFDRVKITAMQPFSFDTRLKTT